MSFVWFCLFALAGVALRQLFSKISLQDFGLGILLCNVLGSFLIGLVFSGNLDRYFTTSSKSLFILAFLGALTTFSSYSLEVARYLQQEKWGILLLCIFSHNLLSISACYMGLKIIPKLS